MRVQLDVEPRVASTPLTCTSKCDGSTALRTKRRQSGTATEQWKAALPALEVPVQQGRMRIANGRVIAR